MKKKKCKLMFFVYILGQGGAERVILNILNHINRSKYEIHLTLGEKDGNEYLPFLKDKDKIQIHYLNIPLGNNVDASSKLAGFALTKTSAISFTKFLKLSFIATKSVSELTSTKTASFPLIAT